ncbi:MAG: phosphopyruvate hydratase [Oligoflexia bacterium]|nr:phosphopyruvate hydratase [Oligoflexia bacterium]
MAKILKIHGREILDSRGNPTVEVDVLLDDGSLGRAAVPSGASTGAHEALEMRDGDKKRYLGKGVQNAVMNVNKKIAPKLKGMKADDQELIDKAMLKLDGTANKAELGANAILGVSLAVIKAFSQSVGKPLYEVALQKKEFKLPVPLMNILNGGAHADNGLDIQEFMIAPVCGDRFSESLRAGAEIFHTLKGILKKQGLSTGIGDEGGFAPKLGSNLKALEFVADAVEKAGYKLGKDVFLALDVAATELYNPETKMYRWESRQIDHDELVTIYNSWSQNFPLASIEDGLSEDDWAGWKKLTAKIGNRVQLVGDDLFVTNPERIKKGIKDGVANAVLIKVNQIGTLTETFEACQIAHKAKYHTVMSHRSGETEDATIADLAVATGSEQIKTGSLCRGERTAKYNQLLRIEEELGTRAHFWGLEAFKK